MRLQQARELNPTRWDLSSPIAISAFGCHLVVGELHRVRLDDQTAPEEPMLAVVPRRELGMPLMPPTGGTCCKSTCLSTHHRCCEQVTS